MDEYHAQYGTLVIKQSSLKSNAYTEHAVQIPADKLKYLNRTSADNMKHVPEDVGTG